MVGFLRNSGLLHRTQVIFGKVTEKNKETVSSLWERSRLVMGEPKRLKVDVLGLCALSPKRLGSQ